MLAPRLNRVVTVIVSADQAGFIPGCPTHNNIHRLFTNLQNPNILSLSRAVVTLDTQKALDCQIALFVLCIGFGKDFLTWIHILYDQPLDHLRINSRVCKPFYIHQGTRQGCLWSPFFFFNCYRTTGATSQAFPRYTRHVDWYFGRACLPLRG